MMTNRIIYTFVDRYEGYKSGAGNEKNAFRLAFISINRHTRQNSLLFGKYSYLLVTVYL